MTSKENFIALLEQETPVFCSCFRAVPDERSDYTPNPRNKTAKQLVEHILGHLPDAVEAITEPMINHRLEIPVNNMEEAADLFEKDSKALIAKLKVTPDDIWDNKITPVFIFGNEIPGMTMPLRDLSWLMLRDMIHHRGQLSVYYRQMGVRNPSIYGPTSEIMEEMMASNGAH